MIKSFSDKRSQELFVHGRSRGLPTEIIQRAIRKLDALDAARVIEDLFAPPGNRLHSLDGDRVGQHAISINDQWRICFRFLNGDAYEVEITDYH
ncbi:MAG: type II toxin-antitoxin system RelE/ParE family toxin [Bacteroidota bacterium]